MASAVAPWRLRIRPAAPSLSWLSPISRCSVEQYSSLSLSASLQARSRVSFSLGETYWPPPPLTLGSFLSSSSTLRAMASGRAPSFASTGPTTPSCCWISASSRCSGSMAWWLCWSARDCAAWTASCAFTVSLSNRMALSQVGPGVLGPEALQLLEQGLLPGGEPRGQHHLDLHVLVARASTFEMRHPIAREPEGLPAGGLGGDLHRDASLERRHSNLGPQGGFGHRQWQLQVEVVALPLEERVGAHRHAEVEVSVPDTRHPYVRAGVYARRDFHLQAAAVHGEGPPASAERVFEAHLDGSLGVSAAGAPESRPPPLLAGLGERVSFSDAEVTEDRAEEVGESPEVGAAASEVDPEPLEGPRPGLGVALPVGAETVVALALLGVGEDLVGLVDLLEAVGRPLGPGNVGVMLPGQPPIGLLDRPVVGVPGYSEDLVVVLVFHHSNCSRTTRARGAGAVPALREPASYSARPKANFNACSTAANFPGDKLATRSFSVCFGMVVIVSRLATHDFGSPSSVPRGASVGICRMRVVTGATVTSSRTA